MRAALVFVGAFAQLLACSGARRSEVTSGRALISDAVHNGGTPGFYFLPPLVSQPRVSGVFAPDVPVVVRLQKIDPVTRAPLAVVATYARSGGPDAIQVDVNGGHYQVNWDSGRSSVGPGDTVEVRVLVAGKALGVLDLQIVGSGGELRNLGSSETVGVVAGRTVPIKFRIERQAVDSDGDGLYDWQRVIGPEGGTIALADGLSVAVPPYAVDHPVVFSVTLLPGSPSGITAYTSTYEFLPAMVFARPLTVTLPVGGSPATPSLFWTNAAGQFEEIGGTFDGQRLTADVIHFSQGVVGASRGTRVLSGASVLTYLTDVSSTNRPEDFSSVPVEALVPNGAGGYDVYPGSGTAAGDFSVAGLPHGKALLLRAGDFFYEVAKSATVLDLGHFELGRPDATLMPLDVTTGLTLILGGMDPWQDGDLVEVYSPRANTFYFNAENLADPPPQPGDTTIFLALHQGGAFPPHLIEGDETIVNHLSGRISGGGFAYTAVSETFATTAIQQSIGSTFELTGAFANVSASESIDVGLAVTAWEAQFGPVGATCFPGSGVLQIYVEGQPGGLANGTFSNRPDFLSWIPPPGADAQSGVMQYVAPVSGTYGFFATADYTCRRAFQLPGTVGRAFLPSQMRRSEPLPAPPSPGVPATLGLLSPAVGFPTAASLEGVDFLSDHPGVGLTPTVSWSATTVGTPSGYGLAVYELFAAPNPSGALVNRRRLLAYLQLSPQSTSVTLPPGLLRAGGYYVMALSSFLNSNPDLGTSPNRSHLPEAHAVMTSGLVTP